MARLVLVCAWLLLLALSSKADAFTSPGPVILISMDGFRADYLARGHTPVLSALAADGARGAGMRPSFPSLTYPNHYAMVTGLRPDRNGIVDNVIEDPARPGVRFTLSDRKVIADPFWWDEGTPLWVSAERAGFRTADMFWPGGEFVIHGMRPSHWQTFDQNLAPDSRVDTVLGYLGLPGAERPRLITLYFNDLDDAGHEYGPAAPQVDIALARVDAAMGRLVDGLKARGLYTSTNLVIVADHGMAATSPDRVVFFEDMAPAGAARLVTSGPVASVALTPGREDEESAALRGRHGHVECWRKDEIPARFHYGANPRVQPVVCLADVGWVLVNRAGFDPAKFNLGRHGFDPAAPDMAAVFVAHGPAFRKGVVVPPFDNVSVYALVARVLGLRPEPGTARIGALKAALR